MAPITTRSNETNHDALLSKLDIHAIRKPFRNPNWRPPQRRNKNVKQIIAEAARKEASASVLATQNNSGTSTPALSATLQGGLLDTGSSEFHGGSNVSAAAQTLSTLVASKTSTGSLSKRAVSGAALGANLGVTSGGLSPGAGGGGGAGAAAGAGPPVPTYTNIESAPSLHPSSQRRYCDITGLPAKYTDPKTRLRYHDKEVFGVVRSLGMGSVEGYLAARGVNTVLK